MEVCTERILPVCGEMTIVPGVSLGEPWRMVQVEAITMGRAYSEQVTLSVIWMDPILGRIDLGKSKFEIGLQQSFFEDTPEAVGQFALDMSSSSN